MLQAWMLQDAPNHRGTERRDYGVGGNAKGSAAQTRRPNKGHIGYGSGENETELDGNAKGVSFTFRHRLRLGAL